MWQPLFPAARQDVLPWQGAGPWGLKVIVLLHTQPHLQDTILHVGAAGSRLSIGVCTYTDGSKNVHSSSVTSQLMRRKGFDHRQANRCLVHKKVGTHGSCQIQHKQCSKFMRVTVTLSERVRMPAATAEPVQCHVRRSLTIPSQRQSPQHHLASDGTPTPCCCDSRHVCTEWHRHCTPCSCETRFTTTARSQSCRCQQSHMPA